ncbi:MAG: hypothetical protein NC079_04395 [Clostridium sp.]|nr:hypothetical protein [Acetatifactor muris]MCM1562833.1 hypothetical protein [Clostridium sp.]
MDYRQGSLTYNGAGLNAAGEGQTGNNRTVDGNDQEETKESSEKKLYTLEDWQNSMAVNSGRLNIRSSRTSDTMADFRQMSLRYIFDLLFGDRHSRFNRWKEDMGLSTDQSAMQSADQNVQTFTAFSTNMRVLNYTEETFQFEQESTSFSTVGTVRTSDGREINFNLDVAMSRQFQQTFQQDLQLASFTMCDPLVINLDTDVAELSDQKFYFDIDADGELDEISQLSGKSGYLALDKNGDGVINDGSELFGTSSGDGFADLAQYDEDGNGWIDEGDAIWSKLKIWCKDENGNDVLYRLADKGVGAICLQNASTDFTLQGGTGQTNGAIRKTGVFLYENGNVGTVQHVDVAKYEQGA